VTGDLKSVSQSRYSTVYDPSQRKVDTFHPPGKTHSLRLLKFGGHQKSFCERERERFKIKKMSSLLLRRGVRMVSKSTHFASGRVMMSGEAAVRKTKKRK